MSEFESIARALLEGTAERLPQSTPLYRNSIISSGGARLAMVRKGNADMLIAAGSGPLVGELGGDTVGEWKLCPLTTANRLVLQRHLSWILPTACSGAIPSIGLGDRLGIATPGHIDSVRNRRVFPVFAQQSAREMSLTGRTMDDVLNGAAFAVFREGYREGYGADADHLKNPEDIAAALERGYSMITLDCSDHIDHAARGHSVDAPAARCPAILEREYAGREFAAGSHRLHFSREALVRCAAVYGAALDFIERVYRGEIARAGRAVDFEISIDETEMPTDPLEHLFIARELARRGIAVTSLAPRFFGEFQKGIDYRGDLPRFQREMEIHAAIADGLGYRISVHSGSDKFSVFPSIGRLTTGRFHLKTAGTSWLEALRVIAAEDPPLYRRLHRHALARFGEARRYYHVSADPARIRPLEETKDRDLTGYLEDDDARQVLHIAYGVILSERDGGGRPLFREVFYGTMRRLDGAYREGLRRHIGRHLDLLGIDQAIGDPQ
ncbi:MAG: tagaturonate epimerase family protein [Spirochaetes bacterium]|nr:tagaturonate epimerase family protein [Spirochaetota bacterium]